MKKGFNIAANVCAIVLMGILVIGAIVLMSAASAVTGSDYVTVDMAAGLIVGLCVGILLFCVATIIVASFAIVKLKDNKALGFQIAVIVLVGITAILEFVGGGVVYGILCLVPIALEIVAICVHNKAAESTAPAMTETAEVPSTNNSQTTDEKIAELKHLRELNAITEEQYDNAVKAIFDEVKK
ncbi:MAG: type IV conjugative transfer system protein TraL [Clostridia bacterium]|nr:type IV conjugative transfer system protein TraL [Clostridia bacterium]